MIDIVLTQKCHNNYWVYYILASYNTNFVFHEPSSGPKSHFESIWDRLTALLFSPTLALSPSIYYNNYHQSQSELKH